MLTPKAFVMVNPHNTAGVQWAFFLYIDARYWDFVYALPCVSQMIPLPSGALLVCIDPRYDYEEAWLWSYEQIEAEVNNVQLDAVWGVEDEAE